MKRFASDRVTGLMERMGLEGDVAIESRMVSKTVENAQSRVEGYNFDIRKRVVEYDDVINKQRERIYAERDKVLHNEDLERDDPGLRGAGARAGRRRAPRGGRRRVGPRRPRRVRQGPRPARRGPRRRGARRAGHPGRPSPTASRTSRPSQLEEREATFGEETWSLVERAVLLRAIDSLWVDHLTELEDFRRGVGLRGYGGTDPLVEFKREAFKLYDELRGFIRHQVAATIFRVSIQRRTVAPQEPTAMPELTPEQLAMPARRCRRGPRRAAARPVARLPRPSPRAAASPPPAGRSRRPSCHPCPRRRRLPLSGPLPRAPPASRPMRLQHGDETVGAGGPRGADAARGRRSPGSQRPLLVRLRQEVQALPRRLRPSPLSGRVQKPLA